MITKKMLGLIAIMLCTLPVFSQNKDAVLGKWLNANGQGQILIYKRGDQYFGKVVWLRNPRDEAGKPKSDIKNPDERLKGRPLLGAEILKDFEYSGEGVWDEGSIYDPKTGKTYSCKMSMESSDKLDIRGFVGISLLGRTETWTRVN